jgi:hypothetical protein
MGRCEACHSYIMSKRARVRFCASCSDIIRNRRKELESQADLADQSRGQVREEAIEDFWKQIECPWPMDREGHIPCGWAGKHNVPNTRDMRICRAYAEKWSIAAVKHFMRHVFWNRFPERSKFKQKTPKRKEYLDEESYKADLQVFTEGQAIHQWAKGIQAEWDALPAVEQVKQAREVRSTLKAIIKWEAI